MTMIRRIGKPSPSVSSESEAQRDQRIAREAELIAQARARLDAGKGVSGGELEAWLDAYAATDGPVPVPASKGGAAIRR